MCIYSIWCFFFNFDCVFYIEVKVGSLCVNGMMGRVLDYDMYCNDCLIKVYYFEYVKCDRVFLFYVFVI